MSDKNTIKHRIKRAEGARVKPAKDILYMSDDELWAAIYDCDVRDVTEKMKDVKSLIAGILGIPVEDVTPEHVKLITDDDLAEIRKKDR